MRNNAIILFFAFAALSFVATAQTVEELNAAEEQVKQLVAAIDSREIGSGLQDREYAIAIYQQILERNPSPEELTVATALLQGQDHEAQGGSPHHVQCSRSQLLALILSKKENTHLLTREILARNLPRLSRLDLTAVPFWEPYELPKVADEIPASPVAREAHTGNYHLYYGYCHSHTACSDGEGTPEEAYQCARYEAKLDFFALTDHGELIDIWPWDKEWETIKNTARKYNEDGVFASLHGFEWSSPIYGHINVIHSDDFTHAARDITVKDVYRWLVKRPDAIGRFNHPGSLDNFGCEFHHFDMYDAAVKQMIGIEMHNGGKNVKYYFSLKGYSGKFNHMDDANQKGWKIGAVGGQDNHGKQWGLKNNYLVGAWAESLTRQGILDAHRGRRTFATEDRNLGLSFKMDGAEMGSRLASGKGQIAISLWDKDNEKFAQISLYNTGALLQTFEVHKSDPKVDCTVNTKSGEYYYIFATQEDGDAALSSPIWIIE